MTAKTQAPQLPSEGYAKLSLVLSVFPVSKTGWYDGMKKGKYPKPVKLGVRSVAWKVEDIRALLDSVGGAA